MAMSGLTATGVPQQPPFLRIIKFVILFLSVIVLALAAYAISVFSGYYYSNGVSGLLIFTVIKTWIIFGIALFLEFKAQHFFWRIILVIAYIISIIFWLSAWAWSASAASVWLSDSGYYDCTSYHFDSNDNYVCDNTGTNYFKREGAALAACAGIGAVIWILCIVHLIFFILACMRSPTTTAATNNNAELGQVKAQEAYPQQQPYPQQQAYPQQPVHNQGPYQEQPNYGGQPQYQQPHPTQ